MKNDDKASISLKKVLSVSIILILLMSISVIAVNSKVRSVKVILSDGYEMDVLTTKSNVSDILKENHIIVLPEESVVPAMENTVSDNNTIRITTGENSKTEIAEKSKKSSEVSAEDLLIDNYNKNIVEKLVVEEVTIPYETETKDLSKNKGKKKEVVKQKGVDGSKEVTYKVKYENDVEVSREEVSSKVTKEPVKKIVEIKDVEVVSRAAVDRTASASQAASANEAAQAASNNGNALAAKVQGKTPIVVTMNTSAYTASTCDKSPSSPSYGITSSGARATAWHTLAAGKSYPVGTIIYIPYFKNKPNGGWFVVQDRGGAISNTRLDVYMNTYNECISFGRRNLECYIYLP